MISSSGRDALAFLLGQPSSGQAASIAFAASQRNAPLHSSSASLHQFGAFHLHLCVPADCSNPECNVAFELYQTRTIAR
ncbi:hypothetical protein ACIBTP_28815 [Streptomyces avidinii]|uniref:hypothetical protein n=1 Tax=Streptomyces avidinii TaxID=1895 RepID=UPI0037A80A9A